MITGVSKNSPLNGISNNNNQSPLKHPPVRTGTYSHSKTEHQAHINTPDTQQNWSKKVQTLINSYENYRNNFNELLSVSPNAIRAVEGLYSEYGQYENVPNSGWSQQTPRSLYQQNALSIPDKIAFGTNIGNLNPTYELLSEDGAKILAHLQDKDGGVHNNNFDRYANTFNKALLSQLKSYVDLDSMATKTDDISRLAYTRLKSYFDNLEIILDDKKLQEFTGIAPDVEHEKKLFVTNRLLPDPMDKNNKNKSVSLWGDDEKKITSELKKSDYFDYLKQFLLDTPTTLVSDPNSLYNQSAASFLNPYEGLSTTVKDMLSVRREHIEDYIDTLPFEQRKKVHDAFFDTKILGDYKTPSNTYASESATRGILPQSYKSLDSDFFKKQREKLGNPADKFKNESKDILNTMNAREQFYNLQKLGYF
jgi:hypothetical protein